MRSLHFAAVRREAVQLEVTGGGLLQGCSYLKDGFLNGGGLHIQQIHEPIAWKTVHTFVCPVKEHSVR